MFSFRPTKCTMNEWASQRQSLLIMKYLLPKTWEEKPQGEGLTEKETYSYTHAQVKPTGKHVPVCTSTTVTVVSTWH